jgi:peptidoglycan/LPS O-acetylase OafA/YrhL
MDSNSGLTVEWRNLDLLRAVAVLCVLMAHVRTMIFGYQEEHPIELLSKIGVYLFFVHTSCVLMLSLDRMPPERRTLKFYVRRAFRIYPLSVLATSLMFWLRIPAMGLPEARRSLGEILANLALVQNLTNINSTPVVAWTLPFELQMYLVLPFIWAAIRLSKSAMPVIWLLLGVVLIRAVACSIGPHNFVFIGFKIHIGQLNLIRFVPCFLSGVVAYKMAQFVHGRNPSAIWPAFVIGIVVIWTLLFDRLYRSDFLVEALSDAFCLVVGAAIPLFKEMPRSVLTSLAHQMAKYSYGIYLSHPLIIGALFGWHNGLSFGTRLALFVACMIVVPVALYHLIESPMIALGKRLTGTLGVGFSPYSAR